MPNRTMQHAKRAGFTLVELSVVLVILGLLVGGVFAGRALLRSSQLQSIGKEYGQYYMAYHTFIDRYQSLPGDTTRATAAWGQIHADPATCFATDSTQLTATCDGNGNRHIGEILGGTGSLYQEESHRAWQHLRNAGLSQNNFTGRSGPNHQAVLIGVNAPASKLAQAGYSFSYSFGASWTFEDFIGNILLLGGTQLASGTPNWYPVLTTLEAERIDRKMDDGKPGTGKVGTLDTSATVSPNCATSTNPLTATYNLSTTGNACQLLFLLDK